MQIYSSNKITKTWIQISRLFYDILFFHLLQNALNAQRVAGLIKTAETMGILDTSTESTKQSDIDEILGFLAALEKVSFSTITLNILVLSQDIS